MRVWPQPWGPTALGVVVCVALLGVRATLRSVQPKDRPDIVLTHVTVIDVATGERQPDQTVSISRGRIQSVERSLAKQHRQGVMEVNAAGKFLIPGLWDMHVHTVSHELDFPLAIANGVTGIRDLGGTSEYPPPGNWGIRWDSLRAWRDQIRARTLLGPRIVAAGVALDGPSPVWPQTIALHTPEEAARVVDSLAREGVDFIKVYADLPRLIYFSVANRARALGLSFAGHVPAIVGPEVAATAGQSSFEHADALVGAYPNAATFDRVTRAMLRYGTASDPTLVVLWTLTHPHAASDITRTHQRYVPSYIRQIWIARLAGGPSRDTISLDERYRIWQGVVRELHVRGVKLLVGSDAWNPYVLPGFGLHDELRLLVAAGMTPFAVLQAATIGAARFLGLADSLGSVRPGQVADLVLLDADPLIDIGNARRIHSVIVDGRLLERPALDSLLSAAQLAVSRRDDQITRRTTAPSARTRAVVAALIALMVMIGMYLRWRVRVRRVNY